MRLSKTDIAYNIINENNNAIAFNDLWKQVCEEANIGLEASEELISIFYTDLSLDGRFITLGDNVWDLRKNHSFDKVHIDMNDIYTDEEDFEEEINED